MPRSKRDIAAVAAATETPPDALAPSQMIARVRRAAGNNLYAITLPGTPDDDVLAELPSRFRRTIWIRRGMFVVVDAAALATRDNKLRGEIVNVVRDERAWRRMPYWPAEFVAELKRASARDSDDDDESEDDGPQMPPSDSEED